MISLKQIFKSFITISLVLFISVATAFGFMGENSFASTSFLNPLSNQIAWGNDNIESADKNLEGKTEAEKLDSQTKDAVSNAIQNPDYNPAEKTGQAQKEERQATKDIKAEANEAMLSE